MFVHLPLLEIQRDLYRLPRGPERFEAYVKLMTGPNDTLALPLAVINPMAKPHVAERLEGLLALDAETLAANAVARANGRLELKTSIQLGLVIADDVAGGWTDRYLTDATHRFEPGELRYGFATTLLWAGESYTAASLIEQVLATCYRAKALLEAGPPKTLRQMMTQEGEAAAFAGMQGTLDADKLDYTRTVVTPHLETTAFPVAFACLYGDAAARSVGYEPLGLGKDAGFALALHDAQIDSDRASVGSVDSVS